MSRKVYEDASSEDFCNDLADRLRNAGHKYVASVYTGGNMSIVSLGQTADGKGWIVGGGSGWPGLFEEDEEGCGTGRHDEEFDTEKPLTIERAFRYVEAALRRQKVELVAFAKVYNF